MKPKITAQLFIEIKCSSCGYNVFKIKSIFKTMIIPISVIEGGMSQAVPEHPKRDFIFSLSTAFGDAYLFQVCISQTEQISTKAAYR